MAEENRSMSNVEELTESTQKSQWGNDEIVLDIKDVIGLLQGKKYFYFDGEYGHTISVDFGENVNKEINIYGRQR